MTEYFNTANEAVLNHDVSAEAAFQRIKALVGHSIWTSVESSTSLLISVRICSSALTASSSSSIDAAHGGRRCRCLR